ncbi:hypothetical protein GE21DRAFT_1216096 [Neurospora crassa]|nr:hypothetical protein GE21DRAFT_1216096 [Neurospora crassa]
MFSEASHRDWEMSSVEMNPRIKNNGCIQDDNLTLRENYPRSHRRLERLV